MQYRILGRTGIRVSVISFGAGPVSGLITGDDFDAQQAVVTAAIKAGINWFDTAPGYGQGQSESNLGRVLSELRSSELQSHEPLHIATKVRLPLDSREPTFDVVRRSVEESLQRLRVPKVTLLQLHNGITARRGDEPASITPADILQRGGVADAFYRLRGEGLIDFIGLTGTGHPDAMREVIRSGEFDTVQTPYNVLNPSAGDSSSSADGETDYGNIIADCAAMKMGVFAIRVFAAGALLGQAPSAHTLKTPYFPLALYQRDTERAARLRETLAHQMTMPELAVRFSLTHPHISSAIIGIGSASNIAEVAILPLAEFREETSELSL
ncbi:MAG: aldo/keto reductase [Planctomycetia bacterium]|nr:aldo/keto reductase [Planctomycetia bacterium]